MRILDIVNQLRLLLPLYTDKVSTVVGITSIVVSSNIATITTSAAHGLRSGQEATLANVTVETPITDVSQNVTLFTFTTSPAHDLTEGWHTQITISGFTDSAWNGEFALKSANKRTEFVIQSTETIPSLNGNEVLHEVRSDGINGRFSATVVDSTTFTITGSFLDGNYSGGTVNTSVRVSGAVTLESAIDKYTKQNIDKLWIFVVMNDADISKSRYAFSDATATPARGDDIRLRLIDGFTVNIFLPSSDELLGVTSLDVARHDLLQPILKSLYGARFPTGLDGDMDFRVVPIGHGIAEYNAAFLVYTHGFEASFELTENDAVLEGNTRAFRDIDYTQEIGGDDTTDATALNINLDDE
jgi:hypothetical protein